jgi:hypothetical protein
MSALAAGSHGGFFRKKEQSMPMNRCSHGGLLSGGRLSLKRFDVISVSSKEQNKG